jgi:hypothetical protein
MFTRTSTSNVFSKFLVRLARPTSNRSAVIVMRTQTMATNPETKTPLTDAFVHDHREVNIAFFRIWQ